MIYKCFDCGEIFDAEHAGTRSERVGEFWGAPAYKEYIVCPCCRSDDYEEYNEDEDSEED